MSRYPYEVRVCAGCHGEPSAPLVSRHVTLRAAVAKARRSDRLQVEHEGSSVALYRPPSRGHKQYGASRYGEPLRRAAGCNRAND